MAISNEYWKMYNGLDFDEDFMKTVSRMRGKHAELFLSAYHSPRKLFLQSLGTVAEAEKTQLDLRVNKARENKIISRIRFKGRPVNWKSWRQFAAQAKSSQDRKRVYDDFIKRVPLITPLLRQRFEKSRQVYAKYGLKPLQVYLEYEGLNLDDLRQLIYKLGRTVKKRFREELRRYSKEVKGDEPEYYDDFYYFRGKIYVPLNRFFKGFDPAIEPLKQVKKLGLNLKHVHVDAEDRPKKTPSAICFFIQIPNDIRFLVKPSSPFEDLHSSFHECGHAMHASQIEPALPYWERYGFSISTTEIFSTLLQRLPQRENFLNKVLHVPERAAQEVIDRQRFMDLYSVAFYSANSLMKLEFQENHYTMERADQRYAELYKEFLGMEIPGRYWQLHHVMPDYDIYSPSYLIAAIREAELAEKLAATFGEEWWSNRKAGAYLKEIMRPGAGIALEEFSKLDPDPFLKGLIE